MRHLTLLGFLIGCGACSPPDAPEPATPPAAATISTDLEARPTRSAADEPLAGAFAALDGEWEGTFRVYVDTRGQQAGPASVLTLEVLEQAPYRLELEIQVEQTYVSESPYFQRVSIRDRWTADGQAHDVRSEGVNKVEGGQLWCVVHKPDDLVVHVGELTQPDTIVWGRDRATPLAVEHFEEQVSAEHYSIRGWGYYGSDDPQLAPRLYFYADYRRPK